MRLYATLFGLLCTTFGGMMMFLKEIRGLSCVVHKIMCIFAARNARNGCCHVNNKDHQQAVTWEKFEKHKAFAGEKKPSMLRRGVVFFAATVAA